MATIMIENAWGTVPKREQQTVKALFEVFGCDPNQSGQYTIADRSFRATSRVLLDDQEYASMHFARVWDQPLDPRLRQEFELSDLAVIWRQRNDPPWIRRITLMLHGNDPEEGIGRAD
jgi:hypothetical protein